MHMYSQVVAGTVVDVALTKFLFFAFRVAFRSPHAGFYIFLFVFRYYKVYLYIYMQCAVRRCLRVSLRYAR